MTTMPPGQTTITILNAPLVTGDRHGSQRRDWGNAEESDLPGCWVQPISGTEMVADREFSATHVRLFAPGTDLLLSTSRARIAGVTYEVNGEPRHWPGPTGARHHIEADLKRLVG